MRLRRRKGRGHPPATLSPAPLLPLESSSQPGSSCCPPPPATSPFPSPHDVPFFCAGVFVGGAGCPACHPLSHRQPRTSEGTLHRCRCLRSPPSPGALCGSGAAPWDGPGAFWAVLNWGSLLNGSGNGWRDPAGGSPRKQRLLFKTALAGLRPSGGACTVACCEQPAPARAPALPGQRGQQGCFPLGHFPQDSHASEGRGCGWGLVRRRSPAGALWVNGDACSHPCGLEVMPDVLLSKFRSRETR